MFYIKDESDGKRYDLSIGELIIGREEGDILVPASDTRSSRRHAVIRVQDGFVEVEDLNSLNGTFVDEVRIENIAKWQVGQVLRCGRTTLKLYKEAMVTREEPNERVIEATSPESPQAPQKPIEEIAPPQAPRQPIEKPVAYERSEAREQQELKPKPNYSAVGNTGSTGGSGSAMVAIVIGLVLLVVGLYGWQHYKPQIDSINSMFGQLAIGLGGNSAARQAEIVRVYYVISIASACLGALIMLGGIISSALRRH